MINIAREETWGPNFSADNYRVREKEHSMASPHTTRNWAFDSALFLQSISILSAVARACNLREDSEGGASKTQQKQPPRKHLHPISVTWQGGNEVYGNNFRSTDAHLFSHPSTH